MDHSGDVLCLCRRLHPFLVRFLLIFRQKLVSEAQPAQINEIPFETHDSSDLASEKHLKIREKLVKKLNEICQTDAAKPKPPALRAHVPFFFILLETELPQKRFEGFRRRF